MTKLFTLKNNKDNYKKYKKIRRWEIMKSLHKKIGAIVLSGVIIGGFSGSVAKFMPAMLLTRVVVYVSLL